MLKCFTGLGLIWIPQAEAGSISHSSVSMSRNSCAFQPCLCQSSGGQGRALRGARLSGQRCIRIFLAVYMEENPAIGVLADCKRAPGEFTNPCAVFSKQNKMCIKDLLIIWTQIKCSWDILSVCMSCVCTELMYKLIL